MSEKSVPQPQNPTQRVPDDPRLPSQRGAVELGPTPLTRGPSGGASSAPAPTIPLAPSAPRTTNASFVIDADTESVATVLQDSTRYPVLLYLWIPSEPVCQELAEVLDRVASAYAGRFLVARLDVQAEPQLAAALGAQAVPMLIAVLQGQPLPIAAGPMDEEQLREALDEVLSVAAQAGVTGLAPGADPNADPEPYEPPLPPLHQEAFDAIDAGDLDRAAQAYTKALKQDPRDAMAVAGLANVNLMRRTQHIDPSAVRAAAQAAPTDVTAALAAADVDIMYGQVDAAFDRLLSLMGQQHGDTAAEEKERLRLRLLDYFEVVGSDDPRVRKARQRLALLLY